jgi:BirA family biotin operon repressor/biotin-[acetyl-CoA-carboxylase] ligase
LAIRIFCNTAANVGRVVVGQHNEQDGTPWQRAWPAGWTVEHVAETGSTNADLLDGAASRPDRSVLVADHQTAGRGRLDRRWEAPAGSNLLVSLLFTVVPDNPGALVRRVSLAAVDAVRSLGVGGDVRLKWPNDVVLDGAKVAGVLAQRDTSGAVVVGIGINIGWNPDGAARLGDEVGRVELLSALLEAFDASPSDADALRLRYREELATLGQRVRAEMPSGDVIGTATDVTIGGQLVVLADDGRVHQIDVADLTHLRPA